MIEGKRQDSNDYDVIIVGARVAGSVLAALLGQQGHRVLLLDKAKFPSDTLSTHFFRAPALRVFEQLDILEEVKEPAPPLTTLWNYIDGHVISEPVTGPDEHLRFFLCERRVTLDWILFQRAERETSVDVRQGANVKELVWEDGRVMGVQWREKDGMHEASARAVIGADGIYSTLARILEPDLETEFPVQRCMYYTYLSRHRASRWAYCRTPFCWRFFNLCLPDRWGSDTGRSEPANR